MPTVTFEPRPIRSDGAGFVFCPLHRATSFACVRVRRSTRRASDGKRHSVLVAEIISRHPRLAEAEAACASQQRNQHAYEAPKAQPLLRIRFKQELSA